MKWPKDPSIYEMAGGDTMWKRREGYPPPIGVQMLGGTIWTVIGAVVLWIWLG